MEIIKLIFILVVVFVMMLSSIVAVLCDPISNETFLIIEVVVSIFLLCFLLKLLKAKKISQKTLCNVFVTRVLMIFLLSNLISPNIVGIDIVGFLFSLMAFKEDLKKSSNTLTNKIEETQKNDEDSTYVASDGNLPVTIDPRYIDDSEIFILNDMVKEEIENQGEKIKELVTPKMARKVNISVAILGVLTFVYALMYFFNIELENCLIYEAITLLLYIVIIYKNNVIDAISKEAIKNPDKDIAQIVTEARMNKKQVLLSVPIKTVIVVLFALIIPMVFFANPRIIYSSYGDGYEVAKCTRGILTSNPTIVIPDTYKEKNVVSIAENAFNNSDVKEVILPQTLECIKYRAFFDCKNLESISIPQSVTEIRASAFENCINLKSVLLVDGIINIRASAFKNDVNLVEIELPDSLEYLGASAFAYCRSLNEITIPPKVIEINGQTFEYCTSLRKVNMHDDIISIHGETFVGDRLLNDVVLPPKITEIKGDTFRQCTSLSEIVIPEGVTRIGGHAFHGCINLKSVVVPNTVYEIGSSAFRECFSLKDISLPTSVYINERAFKQSPTRITYYDRGEV